jgi:tRNA 2-thiouridine synthesizing protein B
MILHTINKSPFQHACFSECLDSCSETASILLIEDAVYAAKAYTQYAEIIENSASINFYALSADVNARGLIDSLCANITVIDDAGFVGLASSHRAVMSWY